MILPAPLEAHEAVVRPEWIDGNGHMNLAYYVVVFDHATDVFCDRVGLGDAYRVPGPSADEILDREPDAPL